MFWVMHKFTLKIKNNLRRKKNRKTAYLYPPTKGGWEKYNTPVIGGVNEIYFDPFVRKVKDKYIMIVSYRNDNSIRISYSENGILWAKPENILTGRPGAWDSIVNRASYLVFNDMYYMWYSGQNNGRSAIGLAMSKDGCTFERCCNNALITADREYEGVSVMNPCVLWDETENLFKMWYSAGENYEPDVICYAISYDGMEWIKHKHNPVLKRGIEEYDMAKVGGCDVIKYKGIYHMFYIGYENIDNARICHAFSKDGINWERDRDNPILSPAKDMWDKHAVYKPTVCLDENRLYLWYNGRTNTKEYIGLAVREVSGERENV